MQASPWFLEVVGRVPRWHRTAWLVGLLALSVGLGVALAMCAGDGCVNRRERTGRMLNHLRQSIQLARLAAGPHAGCPEALAAATVAGVLEYGMDGWEQPVHIRCYGDTLVLRSDASDPATPFDDVVLVAPMAAQSSREVSLTDGVR
ncbi:MAG: hypothetical protein KUG77_20710 [Nannocystaceae bacterium]|nr:hypothetical protein [Nannocystaceae bacterium]